MGSFIKRNLGTIILIAVVILTGLGVGGTYGPAAQTSLMEGLTLIAKGVIIAFWAIALIFAGVGIAALIERISRELPQILILLRDFSKE